MDDIKITVLGDYSSLELTDCEGAMDFSFKAGYLESRDFWKKKDLFAEFLGNLWENILDTEDIKPTLHYICSELLENAVYHSKRADYMIRVKLLLRTDELLLYVTNIIETEKVDAFMAYIRSLLEAKDLQGLFVQKMRTARESGSRKSQLGLITIMKDRGARLSWKFEQGPETTSVTTLARINLSKGH